MEDLDKEIARLEAAGVPFRNEVVTGPGGAQVLAVDPAGNLVELFQPAGSLARRPPPMAGESTRLARRLGLFDAVVIGLGAMIGAGVFAAVGPAADVAGAGLLIGLAIAAAVAFCNAMSSARLAAVYPESGGTYVYGRRAARARSGGTSRGGGSWSARPPAAPRWR